MCKEGGRVGKLIDGWGCEPLYLPPTTRCSATRIAGASSSAKGISRWMEPEPARPLVEAMSWPWGGHDLEQILGVEDEYRVNYCFSNHIDRSRPISSCNLKMSFS